MAIQTQHIADEKVNELIEHDEGVRTQPSISCTREEERKLLLKLGEWHDGGTG